MLLAGAAMQQCKCNAANLLAGAMLLRMRAMLRRRCCDKC